MLETPKVEIIAHIDHSTPPNPRNHTLYDPQVTFSLGSYYLSQYMTLRTRYSGQDYDINISEYS